MKKEEPEKMAKWLMGKYYREMFSPATCDICFDCDNIKCKVKVSASIKCSIRHCKGIIDEYVYNKDIWSISVEDDIRRDFWIKTRIILITKQPTH